MENKKILVVDDEVAASNLVAHRLKENGYQVIQALNGWEGLQKAQKDKPSLILLDVVMPQMDGYEVLEKLKTNPETASIPIIMLSADENVETVVKTMVKGGAMDYIVKPFYPIDNSKNLASGEDELTKKINKLLGK